MRTNGSSPASNVTGPTYLSSCPQYEGEPARGPGLVSLYLLQRASHARQLVVRQGRLDEGEQRTLLVAHVRVEPLAQLVQPLGRRALLAGAELVSEATDLHMVHEHAYHLLARGLRVGGIRRQQHPPLGGEVEVPPPEPEVEEVGRTTAGIVRDGPLEAHRLEQGLVMVARESLECLVPIHRRHIIAKPQA